MVFALVKAIIGGNDYLFQCHLFLKAFHQALPKAQPFFIFYHSL